MTTTYQEGLEDGFVDAMIISQPINTGGHTYEEFCRIRDKYYTSINYPDLVPGYFRAHAVGFNLGFFYLYPKENYPVSFAFLLPEWSSNH